MASAFARSARQSFRAGANAFRASARGPAPATSFRRSRRAIQQQQQQQNVLPQRRFLQTTIPLHDAVAAAKLVSHLSTSSRSRSALSLVDPLSYMHAILTSPLFKTSKSSLDRRFSKGKLISILRPPHIHPTLNNRLAALLHYKFICLAATTLAENQCQIILNKVTYEEHRFLFDMAEGLRILNCIRAFKAMLMSVLTCYAISKEHRCCVKAFD